MFYPILQSCLKEEKIDNGTILDRNFWYRVIGKEKRGGGREGGENTNNADDGLGPVSQKKGDKNKYNGYMIYTFNRVVR